MAPDKQRPEPVSADEYGADWIRGMGGVGSDEVFLDSDGEVLRPRLQYALGLAGLEQGMSILDIGCGRGEVLILCVRAGARHAVGVDYSQVSIREAQRCSTRLQVNARLPIDLMLADAKKIPLADESMDRVFMLDIVEHLHEWELQQVWAEVRRILKPDGVLVVHTLPNVWANRYGYRMARFFVRGLPQVVPDRDFHINEQSAPSLARSLEKGGFKTRVWLKDLMLRQADFLSDHQLEGFADQIKIYRLLQRPLWRAAWRLANWLPTRLILATDLFALAWKTAPPSALLRDLPANRSERAAHFLGGRAR